MPRTRFASTPVFLLLALLMAGCSDDSRPMSPTGPSAGATAAPTSIPPGSVSFIRGAVLDTAMRRLVGARIEALDGPAAGVTGVVGDDGSVVLNGTFDKTTRFRATHEGHETLVQTWSCSVAVCGTGANPWLVFYLRPLAPPIDLAGEYTLTLTAASSCSALPPESRSRSYPATLSARVRPGTADVTGFDVWFHADAVLESLRRLAIGVAGDYIRMVVAAGEGDEPALVEHLGGNRYVAFTGWSGATLSRGSLIALPFDGSIDYVALRTPLASRYAFAPGELISRERCTSSEHRLVFAPR